MEDEPEVLARILNGEKVGTFFHAGDRRLRGHKHWIAFGTRPRGTIIVDSGAREALLYGGKSLLPAGVVGCRGNFVCGDAVEVIDEDGRKIARGLCGLSAAELEEVKGLRTDEAAKHLGDESCEEVIHRDYMVIVEEEK